MERKLSEARDRERSHGGPSQERGRRDGGARPVVSGGFGGGGGASHIPLGIWTRKRAVTPSANRQPTVPGPRSSALLSRVQRSSAPRGGRRRSSSGPCPTHTATSAREHVSFVHDSCFEVGYWRCSIVHGSPSPHHTVSEVRVAKSPPAPG